MVEADELFGRLEKCLQDEIDDQYFNEPREFKSLVEVLDVLGEKVDQINDKGKGGTNDLLTALQDRNVSYSRLLTQAHTVNSVIEDVVTFQHGGLNNSVDTMSDVIREYNRGRADIKELRSSLMETESVLTSRKSGQISLKELWLKKVEVEESLRMVRELENLKNSPHKIQRLIQQRRYLSAVNSLNKCISNMFNEDFLEVGGLVSIRAQLMDLKENLLETCINELKETIIGSAAEVDLKGYDSGSDSAEEISENRSESQRSFRNGGSSSAQNEETKSLVGSVPHSDGHSTNINALQLGNNNVIVDAWSLELKDVDEALEASLTDPSSTGSIFIRLLVKTIAVLNYEEDVERLLMESVVKCYRGVVHKLRGFAIAKLQYEDGDENGNQRSQYHQYSEFVSSLLDASVVTMHRLLYIMKLLQVSKTNRNNVAKDKEFSNEIHTIGNNAAIIAAQEKADRIAREQNKKQIIQIWLEIEEIIINQMKIHMVDPDVVNITDRKPSDAKAAFMKSNKNETKKKSSTKSNERGGFETEGNDDDEYEDDAISVIYEPTSRYAAYVYKKCVSYSQAVSKMLQVAAQVNRVLEFIENFLETELLPVVQAAVNQDMHEMQLNPQHFTVLTSQDENRINAGKLSSSVMTGKKQDEQSNLLVCYAAELCASTTQPLFMYWIQLNQHRSMVSTILDRVVRGYSSSARDEMENLSYKLVSWDDRYKKVLVQCVRNDPFFVTYRGKVFGGKNSVEDLILGNNGNHDSMRQSNDEETPTGFSNMIQFEMSVWKTLWDVSSDRYPLTHEKISNDFSAISTLASISYGSDWLAKQLSNYYNATIRKINSLISSMPNSGNNTSGMLNNSPRSPLVTRNTARISSSFIPTSILFNTKTPKQELIEAKNNLTQYLLGGLKELSKLSEEAIAVIRGELQVICFFFLHKLAHIRLNTTTTAVTSSPSIPKLSYETIQQNRINNSNQHKPSNSPITPTNHANNANAGNNNDFSNGSSVEEESILSLFNQHLLLYQESVLIAISPAGLATILSPICFIIPRILIRCVSHIVSSTSIAIESVHKTRLLRIVVSIQQSISIYIQSTSIEPETKRKLFDLQTEEFERLRRFVTLLDMPCSELKVYLKNNFYDYSKEEYRILFIKSKDF
eukprot:gene15066-20273_t